MKVLLFLLVLVTFPCSSQTAITTGKAITNGSCSQAVTGGKNSFTINCGIGKEQGEQMIAILNKILSHQQ